MNIKAIGKVVGKICLGLGYAGLASYGVSQLSVLVDDIKARLADKKRAQYNQGYDDGKKTAASIYEIQLTELREENERLLKESLK